MPLSVETAVITKKGAEKVFNTDSVNAAGKVWPQEIVHSENGIRAVGVCSEKPYYVLASSKTKGTSASAVDLFQNCVQRFNEDGSNASYMIADYLRAFARVLNESGFDSSACSFAILAGFNDTVYAAKSGDAKLFTYYDGTFTEIDPQPTQYTDQKSSFGVAQCNHVSAGDIFILLPGAVADVFPDGLLAAVCSKSECDVKKIAAMLSAQALKYGCKEAISAVIMKVTETVSADGAAVAAQDEDIVADAAGIASALSAAAAEKETAAAQEVTENAEKESVQPVKRGKRAGLIVFSIILAVALLCGLFFVVKGLADGSIKIPFGNKETTSQLEPSADVESESESESESATEPSSEPDVPSESESETESESESSEAPEESTTKSPSRPEEPSSPANPRR